MLIALEKYREFKRNVEMTRHDFETMKLKKFRNLILHLQGKSPYYADIIKDRNIDPETCKPSEFPILTKSLLMDNFDQIVTNKRLSMQIVVEFLTRSTNPMELLFDEFYVLHTSGSSGAVGIFVYSKDDWSRGMSNGMSSGILSNSGRQRKICKSANQIKKLAFYGAVGCHSASVSMVTTPLNYFGHSDREVGLFEINRPLHNTISDLNEFRPDKLVGYTHSLKVLAESQLAGTLSISPFAIVGVGENMTSADNEFLASSFGCEVTNIYGSTEHLTMGEGNSYNETMTLYDNDLICELFEDHTLITNLYNYTLPLIRYRMADVLKPVRQQNESSPYIVINSIVGRNEKPTTFINDNGFEDFINPHTISEIYIAGVERFQMRVVSKTHFQFAVILSIACDSQQRANTFLAMEKRLRVLLDQKAMTNVTFEVITVNKLSVDPKTRKFKLIVDCTPSTEWELNSLIAKRQI